MNANEFAILVYFRRYQIGPAEMLFFNPHDCKVPPRPFQAGMQSLMRRGMVVKERSNQAYSLTREGYDLSLTASRMPALGKAAAPRGS
jgi:hypothetical protein